MVNNYNKIYQKKTELLFIFLKGYGNFVLDSQSPRWCYSTEEFNERQNKHYHNTDDSDVEKIR